MEEKKTSFANGYYLWANANYIFIFSFFFRRTEFMFIYFFLSVLRHKEWVFILFTAAVGGVTLAAASAAVAEELRKERYNTTKYIWDWDCGAFDARGIVRSTSNGIRWC